MRRRIKSIAAVLVTLVLVCLSAFAPVEYFRHQDEALLKAAHPRQQITATIDPQAEEIYLVRAIHRIYDETASNLVSFSNVDDSMMRIYLTEQLENLVEKEVLPIALAQELAQTQSFFQIGITWRNTEETTKIAKYTVQIYDRFPFYYEMEGKTNKLLSIYLRDDSLPAYTEAQKMELMLAFISYLGLDLVDDWTYSSNTGFTSKKAQLQVFGSTGKGDLALEIVPSGLYQAGTWRKHFTSQFFLIQSNPSWYHRNEPEAEVEREESQS